MAHYRVMSGCTRAYVVHELHVHLKHVKHEFVNKIDQDEAAASYYSAVIIHVHVVGHFRSEAAVLNSAMLCILHAGRKGANVIMLTKPNKS